MASSRDEKVQVYADERREPNREQMETLQTGEDQVQADQRRQEIRDQMAFSRTMVDGIEANQRRQLNHNRTGSVRDTESGNERNFPNCSLIEAARRRRRLFNGHEFSSNDYLDIKKMGSECNHRNALHFVDERLKTSTSSEPSFSACCQHGTIKFMPFSKVRTVLLSTYDSIRYCLKTVPSKTAIIQRIIVHRVHDYQLSEKSTRTL